MTQAYLGQYLENKRRLLYKEIEDTQDLEKVRAQIKAVRWLECEMERDIKNGELAMESLDEASED